MLGLLIRNNALVPSKCLDGVIIDSATYLNWEPIQPISLEEGLGPFFDIVLPFWVKEGEKNRKLNLGFKDIRLGMTLGEFKDLGVCDDKNTWRTCYNNTKVYIYTSNGVTDDRSPIIWIQVKLDDYTDETFQKFLGIFSKKYEETYSFTENDRELFNSNNDDAQLYVLFENGKVGLKINRWKNSLSLHALYQNETESEILMKDVVPTKIKSDDY